VLTALGRIWSNRMVNKRPFFKKHIICSSFSQLVASKSALHWHRKLQL